MSELGTNLLRRVSSLPVQRSNVNGVRPSHRRSLHAAAADGEDDVAVASPRAYNMTSATPMRRSQSLMPRLSRRRQGRSSRLRHNSVDYGESDASGVTSDQEEDLIHVAPPTLTIIDDYGSQQQPRSTPLETIYSAEQSDPTAVPSVDADKAAVVSAVASFAAAPLPAQHVGPVESSILTDTMSMHPHGSIVQVTSDTIAPTLSMENVAPAAPLCNASQDDPVVVASTSQASHYSSSLPEQVDATSSLQASQYSASLRNSSSKNAAAVAMVVAASNVGLRKTQIGSLEFTSMSDDDGYQSMDAIVDVVPKDSGPDHPGDDDDDDDDDDASVPSNTHHLIVMDDYDLAEHLYDTKMLSLLSSALFLCGAILLALAVVFDVANSDVDEAEEQAADADQAEEVGEEKTISARLMWVACSLLLLHVVPEVAMDYQLPRRLFGHGCYGRLYKTSASFGLDLVYLNYAQSLSFAMGTAFQAFAFAALDFPEAVTTEWHGFLNMMAACFWALSGTLCLVTRGWAGVFCTPFVWNSSIFDQLGNLLYMVASMCLLVAGLTLFEDENNAAGVGAQSLALLTWCATGMLWMTGDMVRFCERILPLDMTALKSAEDVVSGDLWPIRSMRSRLDSGDEQRETATDYVAADDAAFMRNASGDSNHVADDRPVALMKTEQVATEAGITNEATTQTSFDFSARSVKKRRVQQPSQSFFSSVNSFFRGASQKKMDTEETDIDEANVASQEYVSPPEVTRTFSKNEYATDPPETDIDEANVASEEYVSPPEVTRTFSKNEYATDPPETDIDEANVASEEYVSPSEVTRTFSKNEYATDSTDIQSISTSEAQQGCFMCYDHGTKRLREGKSVDWDAGGLEIEPFMLAELRRAAHAAEVTDEEFLVLVAESMESGVSAAPSMEDEANAQKRLKIQVLPRALHGIHAELNTSTSEERVGAIVAPSALRAEKREKFFAILQKARLDRSYAEQTAVLSPRQRPPRPLRLPKEWPRSYTWAKQEQRQSIGLNERSYANDPTVFTVESNDTDVTGYASFI